MFGTGKNFSYSAQRPCKVERRILISASRILRAMSVFGDLISRNDVAYEFLLARRDKTRRVVISVAKRASLPKFDSMNLIKTSNAPANDSYVGSSQCKSTARKLSPELSSDLFARVTSGNVCTCVNWKHVSVRITRVVIRYSFAVNVRSKRLGLPEKSNIIVANNLRSTPVLRVYLRVTNIG